MACTIFSSASPMSPVKISAYRVTLRCGAWDNLLDHHFQVIPLSSLEEGAYLAKIPRNKPFFVKVVVKEERLGGSEEDRKVDLLC